MASITDGTVIIGGVGADTLTGDLGGNIIHGDAGDDLIFGLAGDDTLIGGAGNDTIFAGPGRDVVYGGAGNDVLYYDETDVGADLLRLFGGDGQDTLILDLSSTTYNSGPGEEIAIFANQVATGQAPGPGIEFSFSSLGLRAEGFESIEILVDGQPIAPGQAAILTAVDDAFETDELTAVSGNVLDNDIFALGAEVSVLDLPAKGALILNEDGAFTFDPQNAFENLAVGETEVVTFTYEAIDGAARSTGTVSIRVEGVNQAPTAGVATLEITENEIGSGNLIDASGAADVDEDDLFIASVNGAPVNGPTTVQLQSGAVITVSEDGDFTYDPRTSFDALPVGASGVDDVAFTISDGQGGSVSTRLDISVIGENDAPIAANDGLVVDQDSAGEINVLVNDIDPDAGETPLLTVTDFTGPQINALLTLDADGALRFDPLGAFDGLGVGESATLDVTYTIEDPNGAGDQATVTITVLGLNDDPVTENLALQTDEDTAVDGNLIGSSDTFDPDGDDLRVATVNGTIIQGDTVLTLGSGALIFVSPNGDFTYDPLGAFDFLSEQDQDLESFVFSVVDDNGGTVVVSAEIDVFGVNDPPLAVDDLASTDQDTAVEIDILANDDDVDDAVFLIGFESNPFGGGVVSVNATDDGLIFDPLSDFVTLGDGASEIVSFEYEIQDEAGDTASAFVDVTVFGLNDAPNAGFLAFSAKENETVEGDIIVDSGAFDIDIGDALRVKEIDGEAVGAGGVFTLSSGAVLTIDPEGAFTYAAGEAFDFLSADETDVDGFEYVVEDASGATATGFASLTIQGENDAPTAVRDAATVDEDSSVNIDLAANDLDPDDAAAALSVEIGGTPLFVDALLNGPDSAEAGVGANGGGASLASGVSADFAFLDETVQDGLGDDLIIQTDGLGDGQAEVLVSADGETFVSLGFASAAEEINGFDLSLAGLSGPVRAVRLSAQDSGGGVFTFDAIAAPNATPALGTLEVNNGDAGGFDFTAAGAFDTLAPGQSVVETYGYVLRDGSGGSDLGFVDFTVTGVNDDPIATPLQATTDEDNAAFTFDLLAGQIDVDDGDVLQIRNFREIDTTFGGVSVNADGGFEIDATLLGGLAAGESQVIEYSYLIVDSFGGSAQNTFTLTVEGRDEVVNLDAVPDLFVIGQNDDLTGDVSANDLFTTGTFNLVDGVTRGLLSFPADGDGTFTFATNGDFVSAPEGGSLTEVFRYRIDQDGGSDTATVTITVTGVNDAPIADDVFAEADEDEGLSVDLTTLSNARDLDIGDFVRLIEIDGEAVDSLSGAIEIASGALVTPDEFGFVDYDTNGLFEFLSVGDSDFDAFTFTYADSFGETVTATFSIEIIGVNDDPFANAGLLNANEDVPVDADLIDLTGAFNIDQNDDLFVSAIDGLDIATGAILTAGGALVTASSGGAFTYDPNGGFEALTEGEIGADLFTVTFSDGVGGSVTVDIDVNVLGVNDAPQPQNDEAETDQNTAITIDVLANDLAIDDGFTLLDFDDERTSASVTRDQDDNLVFDPNGRFVDLGEGESSVERIEYRVIDGEGAIAFAELEVTVTGLNDDPTAEIGFELTDEDTPISGNLIDLTGAVDPDGNDSVFLSFVDGEFISDTMTIDLGGALLTVDPDGNYTFDPNGAFEFLGDGDLESIEVAVSFDDFFGGFVDTSVFFDIDGVNDAPVPQPITRTFTQSDDDEVIALLAGATDAENDDLSVLNFVQTAGEDILGGALTFAAPDATFSPGAFVGLGEGESQTFSFTYEVSDGALATPSRLDITVNGENDAPVGGELSLNTDEDTTLRFNPVTSGAVTDLDVNDVLTITSVGGRSISPGDEIVLSSSATITLDEATGDLIYDPDIFNGLRADQTTSDVFTITVEDSAGAVALLSTTISVEGRNDDPTADPFTIGVGEDDTVFGSLLTDSRARDADNGDALSVTAIDGEAITFDQPILLASGARLTVSASGDFTYDPRGAFDALAAGETGADLFTATISDGFGGSVDVDVSADILGADDPATPNGATLLSVILASRTPDQVTAGDGDAFNPALAGFGGAVAFESDATDLVSDDTNGLRDIFVADASDFSTERANLVDGGTNQSTGARAINGAISADGSKVVFESNARDLGPLVVLDQTQIYLRDLDKAETIQITTSATSGLGPDGDSGNAQISGDGRFVVFESVASNLVLGDENGFVSDIFLYDRLTDTTTLIGSPGEVNFEASILANISADGSTIVFQTSGALEEGDRNGRADIYAFDVASQTITGVSVDSNGDFVSAGGASTTSRPTEASISANGRYVAFTSSATDLVAGDDNGVDDIFVRDLVAGTTEIVSISSFGDLGDAASFAPSISGDGRFVSFVSAADNLDQRAADTNLRPDVFVHDRITGETIRVTVADDGSQPTGDSPSFNFDGTLLAFRSDGLNGGFDPNASTDSNIYLANIDPAGFTANQNDGQTSFDLLSLVTDPDGALTLDSVSISTDSGRDVSFTFDATSGLLSFDAQQFLDLGAFDFEILTIGYDVFDGATTTSVTVSASIQGENDAPVGQDETFQVSAGIEATGALTATDVDGDALTFTLIGNGPPGDFALAADGSFTYTSDSGASGAFDVTFQVDDGRGGTDQLTARFEINGAPTFEGASGMQVALVDQQNAIDLSGLFKDPEGDALTFSATELGQTDLPNGLVIDAQTGVIGGAALSNARGFYRIEVTATDIAGGSASGEFWLAVADTQTQGGFLAEALVGTDGADAFFPSGGNDFINGDDGIDFFQIGAADGFNRIQDGGRGDEYLVLPAFDLSELTLGRFGEEFDDLVINRAGQEADFRTGVHFVDGLSTSGPANLDFIALDDGTLLTTEDLAQALLDSSATAGDDRILGFAFADTLTGGQGNDTAIGSTGADLYLFNRGDGAFFFEDNGGGGDDVLQIVGYTAAEASFSRGANNGETLIVSFASGDFVRATGGLNSNNDFISEVRFDDVTLTNAEIRALIIDGATTAGDDFIAGYDFADVLAGGAGDDSLSGFNGDDVYQYSAGDDRIFDNGNGTDRLEISGFTIDFSGGAVQAGSQANFIRPVDTTSDLIISLNNNDTVNPVAGSIRIDATLTGGNQIETISFVDQGVSLDLNDVRSALLSQQISAGDDTVIGFDVSDTIASGGGEDYVNGAGGADTYIYRARDGRLNVNDSSTATSETLIFEDLTFDQLRFERVIGSNTEDLVIFSAVSGGSDAVFWRNGLTTGSARLEVVQDANGDVRTADEIRALILAQDQAEGVAVITGFNGADTLPSTLGLDATLLGGGGNDDYFYRAGEARDTIRDTSTATRETLTLTGFSTTDFAAGTATALINSVRASDVVFDFGGFDRLTLHNFNTFEQIIFDDATFDNDTNESDGEPSFQTGFLDLLAISTPEIVGTSDSESLGQSTAADEVFLGVNGTDTVEFTTGEIGHDILSTGILAEFNVNLNLGAGVVTFQRAVYDDKALLITISVDGEPDETITIQNGLSNGGALNAININRGLFVETLTAKEVAQRIVDVASTDGDDSITGLDFELDITAGLGDDFISGGGRNDIYRFNAGDGRDLIRDGGLNGDDTLIITGYDSTDAELRLNPFNDNDLVLDFGADEITLSGAISQDGFAVIENVIFDDLSFTALELLQEYVARQNRDLTGEDVRGTAADDAITTSGGQFLQGRGGRDTFTINSFAFGDVVITDGGFRTFDTLVLPVASTTVQITRAFDEIDDLIITTAAGDSVRVIAGFNDAPFSNVEEFQFTDATLTLPQIRELYYDQVSTAGDDEIFGVSLADTLEGEEGNDFLQGNNGADLYLYTAGDGDDTINDAGFRNADTLEISGVASDAFTLALADTDGDDMVLRFDVGGSIRIVDNFVGPTFGGVETVRFVDDGVEFTAAELRAQYLASLTTAGDDRIAGFIGFDDTLDGGLGFDTLTGFSGDDLYIFDLGDGTAYIDDGGNAGDFNSLQFNGYASADLTFFQLSETSDDLLIVSNVNDDQVVVLNSFSGDRIDQYVFDGGETLTRAEVEALAAANGAPDGVLFPGPGGGGGGGGLTPDQFSIQTLPSPAASLDAAPASTQDEGVGASVEAAVSISEELGPTIALQAETPQITPVATSATETPQGVDPVDEPPQDPAGGASEATSGFRTDSALQAGRAGAFPEPTQFSSDDDVLVLTDAIDSVSLGAGDDVARLGGGNDFADGDLGDDRILGQRGDDLIEGGRGHDTLRGGGGDDFIFGEGGRDRIVGGAGDDALDGGGGADRVSGGRGMDSLFGGGGGDRLFGGGGADEVEGGAGRDILGGGAGADIFVFNQGFGRDRIVDFNTAKDKLDFSGHAAVEAIEDLSIRDGLRGAVLTDGEGGSLLLIDVSADEIDANVFIF